MAAHVSQAEKELMWQLYQKYGTYKAVAEKVGRDRSTVSRHVREYEAEIRGASVVMNAKTI